MRELRELDGRAAPADPLTAADGTAAAEPWHDDEKGSR